VKQGSDLVMIEQGARAFWEWFSGAETGLRSLQPGSADWLDLDGRLRELGVEAWEIGSAVASQARYAFALSPRGHAAEYERCRRIVALAPKLADWEFLAAKPRKQWRRKFFWSGNHIEIDASSWRFIVYQYDDSKVEIFLLGDFLSMLPHNEQLGVLEFVVESELGEGLCIERLCGLDINRQPTPNDETDAVPITELFQVVSGAMSFN
jgi:hypothetical protein